jgi:hypothetical protein
MSSAGRIAGDLGRTTVRHGTAVRQSVLQASAQTWQVTASVWHSWDLPVRNSPNSSVMLPVSIPPATANHQNG